MNVQRENCHTPSFSLPAVDFSRFENVEKFDADIEEIQKHLAPELRITFGDILRMESFFRALGFDIKNEKIPFRALIDNSDARETWRAEHGNSGGENVFRTFWEAVPRLIFLNAGNPDERIPPRGIFFTVHRHNGIGWRQQDIVEPRALFFDDDNCSVDVEAVHAKCPFTALVRTRSGWHGYWAVVPGNMDIEDLERYQLAIASKLGTDPSVKDAARIMRVPGFLHWKRDPFPVGARHVTTQEAL